MLPLRRFEGAAGRVGRAGWPAGGAVVLGNVKGFASGSGVGNHVGVGTDGRVHPWVRRALACGVSRWGVGSGVVEEGTASFSSPETGKSGRSWLSSSQLETTEAAAEGALVEGSLSVGGQDRIHPQVETLLYSAHIRAMSVGLMAGRDLLAVVRAAWRFGMVVNQGPVPSLLPGTVVVPVALAEANF